MKWGIWAILVLASGSMVLSVADRFLRTQDPRISGGEKKELIVPYGDKSSRIVTLEREFGSYGTKFVATLQLEGEEATLANGSVVGQAGANFKLADQSFGFGISDPEFWSARETQPNEEYHQRVYKVWVKCRRIQLLILNEQAEFLVGELVVKVPRAISPDHASK